MVKCRTVQRKPEGAILGFCPLTLTIFLVKRAKVEEDRILAVREGLRPCFAAVILLSVHKIGEANELLAERIGMRRPMPAVAHANDAPRTAGKARANRQCLDLVEPKEGLRLVRLEILAPW